MQASSRRTPEPLDHAMDRLKIRGPLVRFVGYMDDTVLLAKTRWQLRWAIAALHAVLRPGQRCWKKTRHPESASPYCPRGTAVRQRRLHGEGQPIPATKLHALDRKIRRNSTIDENPIVLDDGWVECGKRDRRTQRKPRRSPRDVVHVECRGPNAPPHCRPYPQSPTRIGLRQTEQRLRRYTIIPIGSELAVFLTRISASGAIDGSALRLPASTAV